MSGEKQERELLDFVRDIVDPGVAELLLQWHAWSVANLEEYAKESVKLVAAHRPGCARTVAAVLHSWSEEQKAILAALAVRRVELVDLPSPAPSQPPGSR